MRIPVVTFAALAVLVAAASAPQSPAPQSPAPQSPAQQTQSQQSQSQQSQSQQSQSQQSQAPKPTNFSADMEANLRKAGFTDLEIMPNAVFVRGRDKAGQPVAMVLHPGSMTEMVTLDPHAGPAAGGNGAAPLTGNSTFVAVLPSEKLVTRIIGTGVVDRSGATLGTIRDIAIDHGGVQAYILSVGGLFGLGERFAAVTPTAITLTFDTKAGRYHATMEASVEQLKAAPEFRYRDVDEAAK